jgi:hypothetical protein
MNLCLHHQKKPYFLGKWMRGLNEGKESKCFCEKSKNKLLDRKYKQTNKETKKKKQKTFPVKPLPPLTHQQPFFLKLSLSSNLSM